MRTKLSHITIHRAESARDFERLYRFRYSIYVEEMGRPQRYANHELKQVMEPLDATAANFIAIANGEVVGCLRWNSGRNTDFGEYVELYDMRRAGPYFPHHCGTTTKVMVAPSYRGTALVVLLCRTGYAYARSMGVIADFMDCNPHLEPQFTRFGYRPYRSRVEHPEYGNVLPMLLLCPDLEHLRRINSPLAPLEQAQTRHPEAVRYFHEHIFRTQLDKQASSNTYATH